jgi:hypothetical protein
LNPDCETALSTSMSTTSEPPAAAPANWNGVVNWIVSHAAGHGPTTRSGSAIGPE